MELSAKMGLHSQSHSLILWLAAPHRSLPPLHTESLLRPEIRPYLAAYSYTENGVTIEEPEQKNPYYITGTKRQVYELLQDLTPGGQVIQISEMGVKKPVMLAICDGLILLLVTGFGLIVFRREDLK